MFDELHQLGRLQAGHRHQPVGPARRTAPARRAGCASSRPPTTCGSSTSSRSAWPWMVRSGAITSRTSRPTPPRSARQHDRAGWCRPAPCCARRRACPAGTTGRRCAAAAARLRQVRPAGGLVDRRRDADAPPRRPCRGQPVGRRGCACRRARRTPPPRRARRCAAGRCDSASSTAGWHVDAVHGVALAGQRGGEGEADVAHPDDADRLGMCGFDCTVSFAAGHGAGRADPVQVADGRRSRRTARRGSGRRPSATWPRPGGVVDGEHELAGVAQGAGVGEVLGAEVRGARPVGGPEEQLLHADAVDRVGVAGLVAQLGRVLRDDPGSPAARCLGVPADPHDQVGHRARPAPPGSRPGTSGEVDLLVGQRGVQVDAVEAGGAAPGRRGAARRRSHQRSSQYRTKCSSGQSAQRLSDQVRRPRRSAAYSGRKSSMLPISKYASTRLPERAQRGDLGGGEVVRAARPGPGR